VDIRAQFGGDYKYDPINRHTSVEELNYDLLGMENATRLLLCQSLGIDLAPAKMMQTITIQ